MSGCGRSAAVCADNKERYHGKTDNQNPSRADTDCGSGDYAVSHCE